jgi:hypothetical protein
MGRRRDLAIVREVIQEGPNLLAAHVLRVALSVVDYESPDPVDISLLRTQAVVTSADFCPDRVQEPGSGRHGVGIGALTGLGVTW